MKTTDRWKIVTERGEILDTFRFKTSATQNLRRYRAYQSEELKIEEIKDGESSTTA